MRANLGGLKRFKRRFRRDQRGVAAVELALAMPVLLMILVGIAEFGLVFNKYQTLTHATMVGASQFAFSAGVDQTPYTDAVSAINTAAISLTPLTSISFSVNGTKCTTDTGCFSALSSGSYVTATTTYSCSKLNLVLNLLPNCLLSASQTERVQ